MQIRLGSVVVCIPRVPYMQIRLGKCTWLCASRVLLGHGFVNPISILAFTRATAGERPSERAAATGGRRGRSKAAAVDRAALGARLTKRRRARRVWHRNN